ncbi:MULTISPECIES: hypothetical protein [unclassified Actinomyces]|uniref:hypothetical protein n=1 Tax=unclassified Actinomyces TaxID=2609248 RepID=UPI0011BDD820|nr:MULTISPECIES: hypothetical protein [unclassified Actinomyces]
MKHTDTAPRSREIRPIQRWLAIVLTITVLCAGALAWWRPWDQPEEMPVPPEAVCQDVYNTAELDRILGSSIGSSTIQSYGGWDRRCTVSSGRPPATDARGYEMYGTIAFIEYWHDNEYDAGNGYKWTDETMAADTDNGVQKLDIPELEGNSYLWVMQIGSENYVHGIWFGNGFTIAVVLGDPGGSLDGPKTTQEAMDVMPELLTYVGTQAQEHHAIPNPSKSPTGEPTATAETPTTEPTATSTPSAS